MYQRKKKHLGIMSIILSLIMLLSVINFPALKVEAHEGIDGFIYRCYDVAFGREPDPAGLENWRNDISNHIRCGSDVEYCFVFGDEYSSKNKTDEEFVTDMYHIFLGRDPEPEGMEHWMGLIAQGYTREQVFGGVANSYEFFELCYNCGITAGYFDSNYDRIQLNKVNLFVARLYDICLSRIGDQNGQINWVSSLLTGQRTGAEIAHEFIFSNEYVALNLSDEAYVKNLYLALMGRQYDAGGLENWMNALDAGFSRDEVFAQFVMSEEFGNICADYGINRGTYTPTDIGSRKPATHFRPVKKTYSSGGYSEYYYKDGNDTFPTIQKRYDSEGNFRAYEVYEEEVENAEGTEIKSVYTSFDDYSGEQNWQTYSRTVTSADERYQAVYFYSDEWQTVTQTYMYENIIATYIDPNGATITGPITEKYYVYESDNSLWSTTYYKYDSNYKSLSAEQYRYDGKLINASYFEYYNKTPYISGDTKSTTFIDYDENGKEYNKFIDEYDENGNHIKNSVYLEGKLDNCTVYEYDAKGRNTKETVYDGKGNVTRYAVRKYDARGNNTEFTVYAPDNTIVRKDIYEYNDRNDCTKVETFDYESGAHYLTTYEYDQYGNETKRIDDDGHSVYWEETQYEAY